MMLQKKIDRSMNWLKEKNKTNHSIEVQYSKKSSDNNSEIASFDPKAEWKAQEDNNIKLEKNDILAIILSALIVFGPIVLILFIISFLVFRSL